MKTLQLFNQKVIVAISELKDGNMRFFSGEPEQEIINNQAKLPAALEITTDRTARLKTIYNRENYTEYQILDAKNIQNYSIQNLQSKIPVSDGLATKTNYGILLPLADCLGIVFYDTAKNVLGLLHAGRHNLEQQGAEKFIKFLRENFSCEPENLRVYFSPCAQNYQIYKLNQTLSEAAESQIIKTGVNPENIEKSPIDTTANPDFPSNLAGDKTFRFAIAARLKNPDNNL